MRLGVDVAAARAGPHQPLSNVEFRVGVRSAVEQRGQLRRRRPHLRVGAPARRRTAQPVFSTGQVIDQRIAVRGHGWRIDATTVRNIRAPAAQHRRIRAGRARGVLAVQNLGKGGDAVRKIQVSTAEQRITLERNLRQRADLIFLLDAGDGVPVTPRQPRSGLDGAASVPEGAVVGFLVQGAVRVHIKIAGPPDGGAGATLTYGRRRAEYRGYGGLARQIRGVHGKPGRRVETAADIRVGVFESFPVEVAIDFANFTAGRTLEAEHDVAVALGQVRPKDPGEPIFLVVAQRRLASLHVEVEA